MKPDLVDVNGLRTGGVNLGDAHCSLFERGARIATLIDFDHAHD